MISAAQWLMFAVLCGASLTTWCEGPWTVTVVLAASLAAAALVRASRGSFSEASTQAAVTHWVLVGAALWALVQAWTGLSVCPNETIAAATRWCGMAGIFFACSQAFGPEARPDRWMERFAWFAGGVALLSLVQRFSSNGRFLWIWETGYLDIYGPFASYMDQAALMELAYPFALAGALRDNRRALFAGLAALMAAAVVMSASRAGAALLGLETVTVFALDSALRPGRRLRQAGALAAVLALAVALSAAAGWDRLAGRMQQSHGYLFRYNVLLSATEMIRDRPLAGFGMGNFATAYPAYARFDDGTRVNHAHNEWAEWAVEGGLPLALALALVAAVTLKPAARSVWAIGLIAVLAHAALDYPLRRFGVAGWFFFIVAGLFAGPRRVVV